MDVADTGDTVDDRAVTMVQPGGSVERTSLAELAADRPVLLSFYTIDFSPDCITEWCAFRDFGWFTGNPDLRVVGSSRSGPSMHRRFIDHLDLGFPLIADTGLALAQSFGVTYRAFGVSQRSRRSCFLVDEDLAVRYRWLGEHWLDPTRSVPPVADIYEDLRAIVGPPADEFSMGVAPEA